MIIGCGREVQCREAPWGGLAESSSRGRRCKVSATSASSRFRAALETVHDCLLLFAHYGYPTEQRLRDIVAVEIADGSAQIQKIARALFGRSRAFVPYGSR